MFSSSLPPVVCRRAYVLFTLIVFVYALCFFCLIFSSSMLRVALDCPFLIAPSIFSNILSMSVPDDGYSKTCRAH
jgi:hypothetical protein